jgi:hypothetical protein
LAAARNQEVLKKGQAQAAKIELFRVAGAYQEEQRRLDLMFNKYQYAFDPSSFCMQKATLHPRELCVKVPRASEGPLGRTRSLEEVRPSLTSGPKNFLEAYFGSPKQFS